MNTKILACVVETGVISQDQESNLQDTGLLPLHPPLAAPHRNEE